jgi:hypothetical protein
MNYSAANRKDVRNAEKAARQKLVLRGEVISGIMSVANGREWMYDLLADAFVFADPFHSDPCIAAYNAGLRANGIRLFNDIISFCPHQFPIMLGEHYARSAASDERTRKSNPNGGDPGSGYDPIYGDPDSDDLGDPYANFDRT